MPGQTKVLLFLEGLTDLEGAQTLLITEGTKNFYPSEDGYLQNYPGRADFFERTRGDPPPVDSYGAPPGLPGSAITKVTSFVDFLGTDHLVIVRNDELREIVGNTTKLLYTFVGKLVTGAAYPELFIHESKLVILNEGDFPLIWDGVDGVENLGVQEIPAPPVNVGCTTPNVFGLTAVPLDPYSRGNIWRYVDMGQIVIGTNQRLDSNDVAISGWYRTVVQLIDKYGNHGRVSAPSSIAITASWVTAYAQFYILTEWTPPLKDKHIRSVRQGRTLTLNPDDASPLGVDTIYYTEVLELGTTLHRRLQRLSDSSLAEQNLIDMTVQGPPTAVLGASFGRRIWLVDRDGLVWYSDLLLFGQFRQSQTLRPYSQTVAVVPAGDRIFLIGEHSTEVWYEGSVGPQQLEQDIENGSIFGTTFVAVGDGVVFGLWNFGFGFYDGKTHTRVLTPYYIKSYYVGQILDFIRSAEKVGEWYILSIRKDQITDDNNVLLMFSFETKRWFIIEESVRDLHAWDGEILGVDDSLYVLFRPGVYAASVIQTAGIVVDSVNTQRVLTELGIMMIPSAYLTMAVEIQGEGYDDQKTGTGYTYPILSANRNLADLKTPPYWNKPSTFYPQFWVAPRDHVMTLELTKPEPGYQHKVRVDFPAGHEIKVKAIEVTYSHPHKLEPR